MQEVCVFPEGTSSPRKGKRPQFLTSLTAYTGRLHFTASRAALPHQVMAAPGCEPSQRDWLG